MAKGVPILGKDPLGKAKYANVTESGDLRVQLSGTDDEARLITKPDSNVIFVKAATTTIPPGETVNLLVKDIEYSYFMFNVVFTAAADVKDITLSAHFFPKGYPTDNLDREILRLDESVEDVNSPRYWMGRKTHRYGRFSDWTPVYGGRVLLRAKNHNTEQTRSIRYMEMRGRY